MDINRKLANSGRIRAVLCVTGLGASRGRIGQKLKHESCRKWFFLEDNVDRFQNLGSKSQVFSENPRPKFQGINTAQFGFKLKLTRNETEPSFAQNIKVVDLLKS